MQKPGLGQRLIERVRGLKAGIYRDDAAKFKIKVTEFALDHRYPPGHMYKWVGDVVVPDYETILRLAQDLSVSPGWLHYGDEALQHGHGPSRGKAPRRQGRRTAGSLVLALAVGIGSMLGWPSGAVAAAAQRPRDIIREEGLTTRFYLDYSVSLLRHGLASWFRTCTLSPVAA